MAAPDPVIYILNGDDEFAIARFIAGLEASLGDPSLAMMNINRLEGNAFNPDELLSVACAMPFLAPRRLVIIVNPLARLAQPGIHENFQKQLEKLPSTTLLVLVENRLLTAEKDRRAGKLHWLERWAQEHPERVQVKLFMLPRGAELTRWIQEQTRRAGGQITPRGAELLASLVGGEPRQADQEIPKLLAYVNYQRAVDVEDVELLTADVGQADIFVMVDALGNRDSRRALRTLQRLLEQQDPYSTFGMIVRQFRLLLQARQVLDQGGQRGDLMRALGVAPFVVDKLIGQVRHFSLPDLEATYHRLLDLDVAIKTSQSPPELALTTFVAGFTTSPAPQSR